MKNACTVGRSLTVTWIALVGMATAQPVPEEVPPPPAVEQPAGQAYLGITAMPVTAEAAVRGRLAVREGALITSIVPGGPADRVGLPLGGVIVALDGQRVESPRRLAELVRQVPPGQVVELSYYQGPVLYRKRVRLGPGGAAVAESATEGTEESQPSPSHPPRAGRPLLDQLGRVLDRVAPESRLGGPPMGPMPLDVEAWDRLQRQVDQLQRQVEMLESQLRQLQSELESLKKAGGPPSLDSLPPPPVDAEAPSTTTESGDPL